MADLDSQLDDESYFTIEIPPEDLCEVMLDSIATRHVILRFIREEVDAMKLYAHLQLILQTIRKEMIELQGEIEHPELH